MTDKILCPKCRKPNDIHKFCIYCGEKLLDDDEIRLRLENTDPYCLNCGKIVKKGDAICECGYEFEDVNCPDCNTKNPYTNRFCTSCGKKLWTSDVYDYKYPERLFEEHLFNVSLPYELHNTSLFKRAKKGIGKKDMPSSANSLEGLKSESEKTDRNLSEICSRWKIVSPNYCINCLAIVKPDEYRCSKCKPPYSADMKRIESIRIKGSYVEPKFDSVELKWTPKYSPNYLGSLAPAIAESQFEYRERLKWELSENSKLKKRIKIAIKHKKQEELKKAERERLAAELQRQRQEQEEYIRQHGGGFCSFSCRHCYEEFLDDHGAIVGEFTMGGYSEYYCTLGHSVQFGKYCEDFK